MYSIYNNLQGTLLFTGEAEECAKYLNISKKQLWKACRNLTRVKNQYIVTLTSEMRGYEQRRTIREKNAVGI